MLRKLSRKTKGRTQKKKRKEKIITKFSDDRTRQEKLMNNEREKTLEKKEPPAPHPPTPHGFSLLINRMTF